MRHHFSAPWSSKLKAMTGLVLGILIVASIASGGVGAPLTIGIVVVCAALAVRGYSVVNGELLVHRLGWATRFDLARLSRVEVSPGAMQGSVRTWGIGGLFSSVGYFRNAVLGSYRAYATNEANTVVLDFEGDTIVVTPDSPLEFVAAIEAQRRNR